MDLDEQFSNQKGGRVPFYNFDLVHMVYYLDCRLIACVWLLFHVIDLCKCVHRLTSINFLILKEIITTF